MNPLPRGLAAIVAIALAGCATTPSVTPRTGATTGPATPVPAATATTTARGDTGREQLHAVLWMQSSAEYRAIAAQTWRLATERLPSLTQPGSAALEQWGIDPQRLASLPTAVVVAGTDPATTEKVQSVLSTERLRVYSTDDVIGIELGGALKNVIAIAAGIGDGLGFGHNTRAAIITRGLAEISRLATAMGAHPLTMAGLGGMGDLVLTCTGDLSRNRRVGIELGKGKKLAEILAGMN